MGITIHWRLGQEQQFVKDKIIGDYWLVNNRYRVFIEDGCVYDTTEAKDIPEYIFKLRDKLLNK